MLLRCILLSALAIVAHAQDSGKATVKRNSSRSKITAAYGDAQVFVTGGAKSSSGAPPISRALAKYPGGSSTPLTAASGQRLHVSFGVTNSASGEGLAPHQAFVRLTHQVSRVATTFVAQPDDSLQADKAGVHSVTLDLGARKTLHAAATPGVYAIDIIIGDSNIDNPVVWRIADAITLQPAPAAATPTPQLYSTPLLHESDTTLVPLTELHHTFRVPEVRPPAIVSLAATAVIVGGLVVFVRYAFTIPGFRISVPASVLPWAVAFYACFAAILLLFAAFWWYLNMFATLACLSLLIAPTGLCGRQMLLRLEAARSKQQ